MRNLAAVLILFYGLTSMVITSEDFIVGGIGLEGIAISKSLFSHVKTKLGRGIRSVNRNKVPGWCGSGTKVIKSKTLTYPEKGIECWFHSKYGEITDTLAAIRLFQPCTLRTDKGISIGTSSENDIIKSYGVNATGRHLEYIYQEQGIGFLVQDSLVFEIFIFKPTSKKSE